MSTVLLESSLTTCSQDMSIYFEALSQFILMLMVTKTHQSSLINILKQTPFFPPLLITHLLISSLNSRAANIVRISLVLEKGF